ncbi:hypothetical protein [Streptomyces sp. TLI_105]|uniref:hypothetical protein n=1 Tax=Streptomyces sp. TLI_105 TaxID=1881019 RepID=UPI00352662E7
MAPEDRAGVVALVIPPAWRDVWIRPWPNRHVQAVGTDAAGPGSTCATRISGADRRRRSTRTCAGSPTASPHCAGPSHAIRSGAVCAGSECRPARCASSTSASSGSAASGANDDSSYGLTTLLREHAHCARGKVCLGCPAKSGRL